MDNKDIEYLGPAHPDPPGKPSMEAVENVAVSLTQEDVC
jgi:hypothetical protein